MTLKNGLLIWLYKSINNGSTYYKEQHEFLSPLLHFDKSTFNSFRF